MAAKFGTLALLRPDMDGGYRPQEEPIEQTLLRDCHRTGIEHDFSKT